VTLLLVRIVLVVVLDIPKVLKILYVPKPHVVVVRGGGEQLTIGVHVQRLDGHVVLPHHAEIAVWSDVTSTNVSILPGHAGNSVRDGNHQANGALDARIHVAVVAKLAPVVGIKSSLGGAHHQLGVPAIDAHAAQLLLVRLRLHVHLSCGDVKRSQVAIGTGGQ